MATFAVKELRSGRNIKFAGTEDNVSIAWTCEYAVEVTLVGAETHADISPFDVCSASGLPKVNLSIYYFNNKIIPYVICRDKSAKQDKTRLSRWTVTCGYKATRKTVAGEGAYEPIDPPTDVTDIAPQEVAELGEYQEVLWQDFQDTPVPILTPSGRLWAEPAMERIPTFQLRITQYEPSITYAAMVDRKFKVNLTTYRGEDKYKWLIEHVEANEVQVVLFGGTVSAALVTYTLLWTPRQYGWRDDRALIDSHHDIGISTPKWVPFQDGENRTLQTGWVDPLGAWLGDGPGAPTEPLHVQYDTYKTIEFSGFLQV